LKDLINAVNFMVDEGSDDSELKKTKLKKWVKKNLDGTNMDALDDEWHFRLACSRLCLGRKDFKGFDKRNIRDGIHPFHFTKWKPYSKTHKLLVIGEQGLGDQIIFASMFSDLEEYADEIYIEVDPRLVSIFSRSFPKINFHPRKDLNDSEWTEKLGITAQVYMGDLFQYFRRGTMFLNKYLIPDPKLVKKYKGLKNITAVSWRGRQAGLDPRDMVKGEDAVISLQYGESFHFPEPEIDLKNDIEDLFAILANVKKLISVPTSVVHMAGSIGTETIVIRVPKGYTHGGFVPTVHSGLDWKFSRGYNNATRPVFKMHIHPSVTVYESLDIFLREYRNAN